MDLLDQYKSLDIYKNEEDEEIVKRVIDQRRRQVLVHSYLYYELDESIVSDQAWNKWAFELDKFQKAYPEIAKKCAFAKEFADFDPSSGYYLDTSSQWVKEESERLLKSKGRLNDIPNFREKHSHEYPSLSLTKTKNPAKLSDFLGEKQGILMPKYDGITLILTYDNGHLIMAETRGDGYVGENVTKNILRFTKIPNDILDNRHIVIRGEAVISKSRFVDMSQYSGIRNAASGIVRSDSIDETLLDAVEFIPFDLVNALDLDIFNYSVALSFLSELDLKFSNADLFTKIYSHGIDESVYKMTDVAQKTPYPTDGLVLRYDDLIFGKELGVTQKHYKYAIAYKWEDRLYETVLRKVEWSVSEKGLLTPIACFDPIDICGSIVSKANLHNMNSMKKLRLGIGDHIEVYKANMIIPKVYRSVERTDNVVPPVKCPVCNRRVIKKIGANGTTENYICPFCSGEEDEESPDRPPFLWPNQKEAADRIKNGCILNGGTGSGKSRTSLYYYFCNVCGGFIDNCRYVEPEVKVPLYIITTAMKRDLMEWEEELAHFMLSPEKDPIVIDSWNNIKKYKDVYGAFFIFDEDRVTGSGAWVKAFLKIANKNKWIILSATPGDNWNQYIPVFIANGFYKNKTEFVSRHCLYDPHVKNYPKIIGYRNKGYLMKCRNDILIDMDSDRKNEQHHIDITVSYDKEKYKQAMRTRWDPYKDVPMAQAADLCRVCRHIVNEDKSRQRAFLELVEANKKVIVFYSFDYELDILRGLTYPEGTVVAEWNGHKHETIPESNRWVYLVNYGAGAEGWNSTETDTMIFYSQNYSYKTMVQAAGRIDRANTKFHDLYYYHLKSKASIDLAISKALQEKRDFNENRWGSW